MLAPHLVVVREELAVPDGVKGVHIKERLHPPLLDAQRAREFDVCDGADGAESEERRGAEALLLDVNHVPRRLAAAEARS
jgi:hypothetical protein